MVIHRGNYSLRIAVWRDGILVLEEQIFSSYQLALSAAQRPEFNNAKLHELETMELVWAAYDQPQGYSIGG